MKNKIKIIIVVLMIFFIVALVVFLKQWNKEKKEMIARCDVYYPQTATMIDCYGILSIDWSDLPWINYVIRDRLNEISLAGINNADDFILKNDWMYVVDMDEKSISFEVLQDGTQKYYQDYYNDGKKKKFYYDKLENKPKYIKVNIKSGETVLYQKILELSLDDRIIFEKLERKIR